ncbi:60 kDa SS-A/Ro ribonucleoprotein [Elysia marginata]|uniref:60 kDa SS-A/Ro ribonucleoprotein n=1 Tax=Elysia marginata TaxID=1093978 RepID=A0AAV4G484_9GAST|nr:60 kDa SS-A/Ro ribonucleoprotein [Elysia marginata]
MVILAALRKYAANRLKQWVRNGPLIKALQAAFDASLDLLPKMSDKSMLVAVHLEGEGRKKLHVKGATHFTPAVATAHFIKFMHKTEMKITHVFFNERVEDVPITPKTPIVEVLENLENCKVEESNFDLTEPIKWATQRKAKFDNILIITDLKKVASAMDFQAHVRQYRREVDHQHTKVAVLGLSEVTTTVADVKDLNLLEMSGLNDSALQLLLRFFKGDLDFDPSGDNEPAASNSAS